MQCSHFLLALTESSGAPFITVTHIKLWGQKTLARICVCETKTTSAFTLVWLILEVSIELDFRYFWTYFASLVGKLLF